MLSMDSIVAKVRSNQRLNTEDALFLFEYPDLLAVGRLADEVNWRMNKGQVYYNINRHINPTNICALSCKFCAFSRKPGEEGAYAYTIEEMVAKAREAVADNATEVHMVGGLHPRWPFKQYLDMIAAIRQEFPDLHIKAFTAVELDWMARKARISLEEVLLQLKAAGLSSLPGGGAEIFHPEVRDRICDTKVSAEQWIGTHRLAHSLGLRSNCTMLYGHIEDFKHRVDHMDRLRQLQDETNGFNVFIPLAFQPYENELGINRYTFGYDDLKTIAVARLFLDNFRNIKAYWIMAGQDIAQTALAFGANDVDGTVKEEKISRMAGGRAGNALARQDIVNIIQRTGRVAIERDTLYRPVRAEDGARYAIKAEPMRMPSQRVERMRLAQNADLGSLGEVARGVALARHGEIRMGFAPGILLPITKVCDGSLDVAGNVGVVAGMFNAAVTDSSIAAAPSQSVEGITNCGMNLILDLHQENGEDLTEELLLKQIRAARRYMGAGASYGIAGVGALIRAAKASPARLVALAAELRSLGVALVQPSIHESLAAYTPSEIATFHRAFHQGDLPTVARIELDATAGNVGFEILWDKFQDQLMTIGNVQDESSGILGVEVLTSKETRISIVDYLRAVAMARVTLSNVDNIIVPHQRIPVLSPTQGYAVAIKGHPSEKVAALTGHFGGNDFGLLDPREFDIDVLKTLTYASGLNWRVRSLNFGEVFLGADQPYDHHFPRGTL
jgi:aminodeoxyfutalosine synthase